MNVYISLIFILAYLSFDLTSAEQSTRGRIAKHQRWLEERAARKRLYLQQQSSKNNQSHVTELGRSLYRPSNYDLNEVTKPKWMKSSLLGSRLRSKYRNKYQTEFILKNDTKPIELTTTTTIMPLSLTEMSGMESTTAANAAKFTVKPTIEIHSTTDLSNDIATLASKPIEITSTTTTTESSISYNVTQRQLKNVMKRKRKLSNAYWSRWQKWTKCSRNCGGGVMSQSRQCLSRDTSLANRTSNECIGLQTRYRLCNEQSCPDHEIDFRDQQCTFYNNQTFHGNTYSWESYIVDEAECELNCKPIGMDYFAKLKDRVADGTTCTSPVDFVRRDRSVRAMCVEGVCKAIHSNGILTGAFMNSGAVRCGSTVCNPVSHTYIENPQPNGYYYHVATIPAGASNISILELKNSENLLVLKRADHSFIINGNSKVSDSGVYNAAGTTFDYRRIDDAIDSSDENTEGVTEWITATGPIREVVHLLLLNPERNPGIRYEYLLPVNPPADSSEDIPRSVEMEADMPPSNAGESENSNKVSSSEKRKRKISFIWRVVSFTSCSKSCGGGMLTPIIRCVREGTTKFYAHKRCAHLSKPTLNENMLKCNSQPCPAFWKLDEWSACNCGLPNENEYQARNISCVQELTTGMVIRVNDGACLEDKPENRQECSCPKQMIGYVRNAHKHKSHKHHNHHHHGAPMSIIANSSLARKVHVPGTRKTGVWLASNWSDECSTKCGEGTQYRSIFCDRSSAKSERCDIRLTPDTTRSCTETARCNVGDWFIGPWSDCFGDCFNLMRSRSVLCIKDDQIVGDSMCADPNSVESNKPVTMEKCKFEDVPYCKPKWHYSEWSECTKSCGSGTQRRVVKCFEPNADETILMESDKCNYSERSPAFRSCNTDECDDDVTEATSSSIVATTKKRIEPKVRLIQNDSTPKCVDEYPNCHIVVKARLCTYPYYIENCCATCKEAIAVGY